AACAVAVVYRQAVDAFGVIGFVVTKLVQVVAAFIVIAAEPARLRPGPDAVRLLAAIAQCSQPAAQTVVGVAPQGVAVVGCVQKYPGVVIGSFGYFRQIPAVGRQSQRVAFGQGRVDVPQAAGIELFAFKGQFAAGIGDQQLLVRSCDLGAVQLAQVPDLDVVGANVGVCDDQFVAVGFARQVGIHDKGVAAARQFVDGQGLVGRRGNRSVPGQAV
ncbi:hypothetical protein NE479_11960, partial [Phascolarctobacterium faecium]